MPVISQWKFTNKTEDYDVTQLYDNQFITYAYQDLGPSDVGDGRPYLRTPIGGTKACIIEQARPFFFPGTTSGYILAGLIFYGGTSGSVFDMRGMIQSSTEGGFYQLRVTSNPDGTVDIALGATPPGVYGLKKAAKLYFNELASTRAMEDLEDGDLIYVKFGWDCSPADSSRPVLTLYGGVGTSGSVPVLLTRTYDFSTFPSFVAGGHTPPFDPTTEEILSISPSGLYQLGFPVLEHSMFFGPEQIRVFSYIVKVAGSLIVEEGWEIPEEYTTVNEIIAEHWEPVQLSGLTSPEYRAFGGGYRRW